MPAINDGRTSAEISGVKVEYSVEGSGAPLLFLGPGYADEADSIATSALSEHFTVYSLSHPGFGNSDLPEDYNSVDDLAYFYLDVLEHFDLRDCLVVGVSLGAWIALELATKNSDRISGLILGSPYGAKVGDGNNFEIADIFDTPPNEWDTLFYEKSSRKTFEYTEAFSLEDFARLARNRETLTLLLWEPYAQNPKLKRRLARINVPTKILFGSKDRILPKSYIEGLKSLISGAEVTVLDGLGHFLHIESPGIFSNEALAFYKTQLSNEIGESK